VIGLGADIAALRVSAGLRFRAGRLDNKIEKIPGFFVDIVVFSAGIADLSFIDHYFLII
jgi:hypothetical protein